jgi:hypothetical protein
MSGRFYLHGLKPAVIEITYIRRGPFSVRKQIYYAKKKKESSQVNGC